MWLRPGSHCTRGKKPKTTPPAAYRLNAPFVTKSHRVGRRPSTGSLRIAMRVMFLDLVRLLMDGTAGFANGC